MKHLAAWLFVAWLSQGWGWRGVAFVAGAVVFVALLWHAAGAVADHLFGPSDRG